MQISLLLEKCGTSDPLMDDTVCPWYLLTLVNDGSSTNINPEESQNITGAARVKSEG